jgi:(p)ppGpp synthase/HD superfamily hydrolase
MVSNLHVQKAIEIAVKHHFSQVDRSGDIYILHPFRVMTTMSTPEERIIAVLHDILEDTIVTEDYLLSIFPKDIVDDIKCLTKGKSEAYDDFILRVKDNPRAKKIKLADISDNISFTRVVKLPEEQRAKMINKYSKKAIFGKIKDYFAK